MAMADRTSDDPNSMLTLHTPDPPQTPAKSGHCYLATLGAWSVAFRQELPLIREPDQHSCRAVPHEALPTKQSNNYARAMVLPRKAILKTPPSWWSSCKKV